MFEPLFYIGSLYVTYFSVAIFFGTLIASLLFLNLVRKNRKSVDTALEILPLSLILSVMLSHALYVMTKLIIGLESYDDLAGFLLNPGMGGFMYLGVFAAVGFVCYTISHIHQDTAGSSWMQMMTPAVFLLLAVVRFAEPLDGLGKGPSTAAPFFPLSYAPEIDYPEDQYIPAFFYAGLYALILCLWSCRQAAVPEKAKKTPLYFFVLYLAGQMFYEIFRRDAYANDTSIITFVRLGQLYSAILLGVILVYGIIKTRKTNVPAAVVLRCAVFSVSVGACVGLQFLFDKPLPLFGQTIWFPDWLVYLLLLLTAVGMGWAVLYFVKRIPAATSKEKRA